MKYNAPFGASDPNAGYSNGNIELGQKGDIPHAAALEHTQREIVDVITYAGITPSGEDLTQLRQAIVLLAQSQGDAIWVEITGSANELVLTAADFTGLEAGQIFRGFATANNTSGSVTANVNGAGAKAVKKSGAENITHSDITTGAMVDFLWDGTNMQLLNPRWGGDWRGKIGIHHGTIASIKTGWQLADGTNGTPDLRDKFIIGARQDDSGAAKTNVTGALTQGGGSANHNHGGSTGGHALTEGQLPLHTHDAGTLATASAGNHVHGVNGAGAGLGSPGNPAGFASAGGTTSAAGAHTHAITGETGSKGSGEAHSHSIPNASHLPPYYALAFIMKL